MKSGKLLLLIALSAAMSAGVRAQSGAAAPSPAGNETDAKKSAKSEADSTAGPLVPIDDPNYTIGPEDELSINVWKETELTRIVPVRPDGKISLPLINDVQAAGLTPMQLRKDLQQRLKKFIDDPQVTVVVTKMNSRRVFVVGEVARAGAYPLIPNMTVLQALSSAGGFTQFANVKKIRILRTEDGKQTILYFNYKDVVQGKHPETNILLKASDTIVVP